MSFASRNTPTEFSFHTPSTHEFRSLLELCEEDADKVHTLRALHLNDRGDYGDAFVAITDDCKINLPGHLTRRCKGICADRRSVREINEGLVGFTVEPYENEHGSFFTIKWVDLTKPAKA